MKSLGYYPGCSVSGTAREYDESLRAIAPHLGIILVEIPDWNCCGASSAHNLDHDLALALPARILALAEAEGLTDILVPCAACYNRLVQTRTELNNDPALRNKISKILGLELKGTARPINIIEMLSEATIDEQTATHFNHAVACYYGCLLVRPQQVIKYDRPEDPQTMDIVLKKLGVNPISWEFKTECCGAGLSVARTDIVGDLSARVLKDAVKRGAEAVVVACPMCHANLDMRRPVINKNAVTKINIPVLYITQAIGLALGISEKELGLQRHIVPVKLKSIKVEQVSEKAPQKEVQEEV